MASTSTHVHAAELALMRAEAALGNAVGQLTKADHSDIEVRREFIAMANRASDIHGDIRGLLKKLREVRHAG